MSHTCGIGFIPPVVQPVAQPIVPPTTEPKDHAEISEYIDKIEDNGSLKTLKEMYIEKLKQMQQNELIFETLKEKYAVGERISMEYKKSLEQLSLALDKREQELKEREERYKIMERDMLARMTESASRNDVQRAVLAEREKNLDEKKSVKVRQNNVGTSTHKKSSKKKVGSKSSSGVAKVKPTPQQI